jgi:hypothetical protein
LAPNDFTEVVGRLALVGHDHPVTVGRERQHVRQRADPDVRSNSFAGFDGRDASSTSTVACAAFTTNSRRDRAS